jgi:hypothetical protein
MVKDIAIIPVLTNLTSVSNGAYAGRAKGIITQVPSVNVVVLGQYEHALEVGVDLYVEINLVAQRRSLLMFLLWL